MAYIRMVSEKAIELSKRRLKEQAQHIIEELAKALAKGNRNMSTRTGRSTKNG